MRTVRPVRARLAATPLWALALVPLCTVACGGCGGGSRQEAEAAAPAPSLAGTDPTGPPIVVGRTLDAATGEAVVATLRAPGGTVARSGEDGSFLLRLPEGTSGDLVAETEDGRVGRVVLRPLAGGRLEVVIHVRRRSP